MTIEKRKLLWDEGNHLEAIDDNIYVSIYWHAAGSNSSVSQSIETDYIGNNVAVADATGAVQQVTYYYPYGKPINDTSSEQNLQPYKYSGKEQETMMGLTQYDFHARTLDYTYARFTTQDPLAEKYYNISPYAYCGNNPVRFIDPDGNVAFDVLGGPPRPGYVDYRAGVNMRYVGFFSRHPLAAVNIGFGVEKGTNTISTVATRFATRGNILYGSMRGQTDEGSENGAFRHTLWQAGITSAYGSQVAMEAGNAHEENPKVDLSRRTFNNLADADQTVDLLNNQIGRSIGAQNEGVTMNVLAGLVLDEFATNGLYTATKGENSKYTISKTVLSTEKYSQLKEIFKVLDRYGRKPEEIKETPAKNPNIGTRQPFL
jgi:RHS repeat-associated protein